MNAAWPLVVGSLIRLIPISLFMLFGVFAEQVIASFRAPQSDPGISNRITNYGCTFFYHLFDGTLGFIIPLWIVGLIYKSLGLKRSPIFHSNGGVGTTLLCVLFALIFGDFVYYWFHRWQHSSRWMWPIHELHHSDECMNVTTAWRIHWLESPFRWAIALMPTIFLPNPIDTIPTTYVCVRLYTYFTHMNARISLGPFTKVIGGPQFHRLHHSLLPQHIDKNFMGMFPVWDILFGTYCQPKDEEFPPTGVASAKVKSLREAMLWPFPQWIKILRSDPIASDRS